MPIMDGYTATREIRKHERFKELPIIASTDLVADRITDQAASQTDKQSIAEIHENGKLG